MPSSISIPSRANSTTRELTTLNCPSIKTCTPHLPASHQDIELIKCGNKRVPSAIKPITENGATLAGTVKFHHLICKD